MNDVLTGLEAGGLFPRLQERYGLREDPLAMETPFYAGAQRQHALETLRHLCGFGDLALLLTGARGAGKTRLLGELVRSEGGRLEFFRIHAGKLDSTESLVRALYRGIGRRPSEDQSVREALGGFFTLSEEATCKGRRQVLLLDDAEQATPAVLRTLLDAFRAADRSLAAVPILAGSGGLQELIGVDGNEDLATSVHAIGLPWFEQEDIRQYLEPRILKAGGKPSELLSGRRLEQLTSLSQGSPGRLQRIGHAVWLDMVSDPSGGGVSGVRQLPGYVRWVVLGLVLLAGSWWFVASRYHSAVEEEVARNEPKPEPTRSIVTVGPESPADGEESASSTDDRDVQAQEPVSTVASSSDPSTVPDTLDGNGEDHLPAPEPEPEPEPEPPVENAPSFAAAMPERFVHRDDVHAIVGYTAQLVAGYEEQTATSFIQRYPELPGLRYTRSQRNGRNWFVVYLGQFDSREAARASIADLPSSIRSHQPWIRGLGDI